LKFFVSVFKDVYLFDFVYRHGVTAMVRIFINYGRPDKEKEYLHLVRLKEDKQIVDVATITQT